MQGNQPSLMDALRDLFTRRKVFVSYHHDLDQGYYDHFSRQFCENFDFAMDNSLDRKIGSDDSEYVMRRIREDYLTGSSVTLVLCGKETPWRKYVDWEICASLNQQMGLIGINLPTNPLRTGGYEVPDRLYENITSGYAQFIHWNDVTANPVSLRIAIQASLQREKHLIRNGLPTMRRNGTSPY